jgi:translation initiation factor IF-1
MPKTMNRAQGFRGRKALEASVDLLDVLIKRERVGLLKPANKGGLKPEERLALQACMVGRITRMVGNGQALVYCQDNLERRTTIRGILRSKKGGAYMDVGSIVVVALENPMTELGESDDEGDIGPSRGGGGSGYIVGIFGERDIGTLQSCRINKRVFALVDATGAEQEDIFDRGADGDKFVPRHLRHDSDEVYKAARAASDAIKAAAAATAVNYDSDGEAEVNMDDL